MFRPMMAIIGRRPKEILHVSSCLVRVTPVLKMVEFDLPIIKIIIIH
jgi:hypothetical protein